MQDHEEAVSEVGFVPYFEDIAVDYDASTTVDVHLHDGSHMRLRKLHEDYEPTDKANAVKMLMETHERGEVLTGVFYIDTQKPDFTALLNMVDEPLATLPQERVRPSRDVLTAIMEAHF
jgi:2-oxoglutarate ferredoxin oxidoreductase subunit beta